jgi:hypothetical protein
LESLLFLLFVQKQTGEALVDYLKPRLFEPLGIAKPIWDTNFQGIALGGYGLRVRTEDIAKLGQLYLQEGEWDGKRLLEKEWVAAATSKQVSNGSNPDSDWAQGYGFQFWRCRHGAYRGDGAFGQYCVVLPEQDAVVAITSGVKNMQSALDVLWDKLLPAFHYVPLPENTSAAAALQSKLKALVLPPAKGKKSSPLVEKINGKTFRFLENDGKFESLEIKIVDHQFLLTTVIDGSKVTHPCAYGEWQIAPSTTESEPTATSYAWEDEAALEIKRCAYETPFVTTTRLHFGEGQVKLEQSANVAFGPGQHLSLEGVSDE